MDVAQEDDRRGWLMLIGVAVVWVLSFFAARVVLESAALGTAARIGVALAPLPFFLLFLRFVIRGIRASDELERRIHLEALAVAFPGAMLLLMTLGLLELAVELDRDDWSYRHVWQFLPILYLGGLVLARRRYQ
jgi:drug/metabolite transporter (DMT)-like permease